MDFNLIQGGGTTTGTDTYTVTLSIAVSALRTNATYFIIIGNTNTGASTLNINSLGAKSIKKCSGQEVNAGDLVANVCYLLRYDGTDFIMPPVPNTYRNNLIGGKLTYATAATITIGTAAEDSIITDVDKIQDIVWNGTTTIDITASGAGGLDTGVEAADTWYAVYAIGDSTGTNAADGLLSLSATAPTMPAGYDLKRRLGWIRNDGSSNILAFEQTEYNSGQRIIVYKTKTRELTNGNATILTDVDCSPSVPSTLQKILLFFDFNNANSNQRFFEIKDKRTQGNTQQYRDGSATTTSLIFEGDVFTTNQTIQYRVDNAVATLDIDVYGYEDKI